ncbi:MAG: endonuclease/exonuclease/phosphatase family protein [Pseudomonadota bacterium]
MEISVGTFNLNNLFSRYNFRAEVADLPADDAGGLQLTFAPDQVSVRSFMGRLVRPKDDASTSQVAARILAADIDILAVQEVEHIEILRRFNRDHLNGLYPFIALIEGNDRRLIDIGVMSRLPLGAITSHQTATHPDDPTRPVFGRDLQEVEILAPNGSRIFTIYNNHLKSHFVPFGQDPVAGAAAANARRRRQAETVSRIVSARQRAGARFIVLGDMNDPPDSPDLAPMLTVDNRPLTNALAQATETRPPKPETPGQGPGPASPQWTHRFNPPGPEFPRYELFDQIWLSDSLAPKLVSAHIDRRTKHGGDGSDHDPAWVVLDL